MFRDVKSALRLLPVWFVLGALGWAIVALIAFVVMRFPGESLFLFMVVIWGKAMSWKM